MPSASFNQVIFEQYLQGSSETEFKVEKKSLSFGQFGIVISHLDGSNRMPFAVSGDILQNLEQE